MKTLAAVKRAIESFTDTGGLRDIELAARSRIKALADAAFAEKCAARWASIKDAKPGDVLFSHWNGFGGRGIVHGDRLEVYSVQPRKLLLWVRDPRREKNYIALRPSDVAIYDVRKEPTEKPADKRAVEFNEALRGVVS